MSDKKMNAILEKKTIWWNEPMVWLIIALPLTAVIASLTTWWIAAKNADTLVKEEYVKEGMAVHQVVNERDLNAATQDISAALTVESGRLSLALTGRLETSPNRLVLTMVHPTDSGQDRVVLMESDGRGGYGTTFTVMPETRHRLELMPADKTWRLTGLWQPPIKESIKLAPSTQFNSTQQPATQP